MKRNLLYLAICLCGFCSCESTTGYRINGYIPGAPDGVKVYLQPADAFRAPNLDSTVIKNERFVLENNEPMACPRVVTVSFNLKPGEKDFTSKKSSRTLFLKEGDRLSIECPVDSLPSAYWEARDKSLNVNVQGSADQDLYVAYVKNMRALKQERNQLNDRYYSEYLKPENQNKHNPELMDMVRQVNAMDKNLCNKQLGFVKANKASMVALYLGTELLSRNTSVFTEAEIDAIRGLFDPALLASPQGERFEEAVVAAKVVAKGKKYSDMNLVDLQGNPVKLSDFVKEGQCNMLEFWASWCSPCRGEIPHLRQIYKLCEEGNFNMISISIDEKDADWKKAVKEESMEWTQLCDPHGFKGECNRVYHLNGVPFCLVLDREGKIVCSGLRGIELDVALKDLLGDKLKF